MSGPPSYLTNLFAPSESEAMQIRPRVTLTFAQSLDAKIAGALGAQLILSGKESMVMTHWLRTMHDGILVGIGTALNDDPQLNTRHLPPATAPYHLPRPIILDSNLRLKPMCKLLRNFAAGSGRRPWIVAVEAAGDAEWNERRDALESTGARVLVLPAETTQSARVPALLHLLRTEGIQTLMVEGGATVIGAFLAAEQCVDTLLITTAPVLVGPAGVSYNSPAGVMDGFRTVETRMVGLDSVVVMSRSTRRP